MEPTGPKALINLLVPPPLPTGSMVSSVRSASRVANDELFECPPEKKQKLNPTEENSNPETSNVFDR